MATKRYVFASGSPVYVQNGSTKFQVAGSTGLLYSEGIPIRKGSGVETITWSSGGLSVSTASAYGVTYISMTGTDPSTSPYALTLANPIIGERKVVILESTAAWINTIDIDLGANAGVLDGTDSTTARYIAFSTLGTQHQSVSLIGVTTALWAVTGVASTIGGFGAATGIRSGTAARTS